MLFFGSPGLSNLPLLDIISYQRRLRIALHSQKSPHVVHTLVERGTLVNRVVPLSSTRFLECVLEFFEAPDDGLGEGVSGGLGGCREALAS